MRQLTGFFSLLALLRQILQSEITGQAGAEKVLKTHQSFSEENLMMLRI
jgi:hypothetical protein